MTLESRIDIQGLDAILAKFPLIRPKVVKILRAGAITVKGQIAKYAPATAANKPRGWNSYYSLSTRRANNRWYQRGYGTKWVVKSGAVHGRKTSETLGRRWTTAEKDGGLTQVVGNNASYGPHVQSEKQARFHRQRGWKTTDDVAQEWGPKITKDVSKGIDEVFRGKIT